MQENNGGKEKQGGLSWSTPSNAAPQHKPAAHVAPVTKPQVPASTAAGAAAVSNSGKYIGMVVVGVLAGVVVAWAWSAWRPSPDTAQNTNGTATSTVTSDTKKGSLGVDTTSVPGLGSDASLSIQSPQAPGTSVSVAKAVVAAPTWVVVYENKEGKPGNALGAALFFPERATGTVELLRATVSGRSYLAVKQADNGDRKFSLKDDQYVAEGGAVQWVTFEVK